jgi:sulfur relay (sulfurtransferase) DsrC/TusE family protein
MNFVRSYYKEFGERPTQTLVAEEFGVTQSTIGNIMRTDESLPGGSAAGGRALPTPMADSDRFVLTFVRKFALENGWAPSQREIAEAMGTAPHKANFHLHRLHEQGLIELGPNAREIRIVGAKMEIPEVTL